MELEHVEEVANRTHVGRKGGSHARIVGGIPGRRDDATMTRVLNSGHDAVMVVVVANT